MWLHRQYDEKSAANSTCYFEPVQIGYTDLPYSTQVAGEQSVSMAAIRMMPLNQRRPPDISRTRGWITTPVTILTSKARVNCRVNPIQSSAWTRFTSQPVASRVIMAAIWRLVSLEQVPPKFKIGFFTFQIDFPN